jgi:hypothetical protein
MMQARCAELLDYLDVERRHLIDVACTLAPERWGDRPAPDRWSVSEILWHLWKVERKVARLIVKRTDEARSSGHPLESDGSSVLGMLDPMDASNRSRRLNAPLQVTPTEAPDQTLALQQLTESRTMMREAIASADGLALATIKHPHPVFGDLDLYQWILFVGHHERRHAEQIAEVAAAVTA